MRTYSNFALVNLKKPQVESNRLGDIKVTTQDGTRIEFNTRDMVCIACVLGGNLTVNECYIGGLVGSDLVSEDNVLRFPISNIIFIAKEQPIMEDNELRDQYYRRKKQRIAEYAEEIPFDELFDYIRKLTGLDDLQFTVKLMEDRYGNVYPKFKSQDIVDKVGFLKLMFSEIEISEFNSQISAREPEDYHDLDYTQDYPLHYWCTVDFSYTHPGGGSNGCTFLTAWYDGSWEFRLEGENR